MQVSFCTRCGGNDLRNGVIRNADQIHFLLTPGGNGSSSNSGSGLMWHRRRGVTIPLTAAMCMDCGHIEMRGDIHAARRLEADPDRAAGNDIDTVADALHRAVG